jgi:hypothetical protein
VESNAFIRDKLLAHVLLVLYNSVSISTVTSAQYSSQDSMIFKIQALAVQLHRVLLITIVFSFLKLWDAAANI